MYTNTTLLPKLTKKQQEILLLLYRFRFLNRIHIQTLLNHKDYHRINIWLKDLTQKEYTGRIYSNKLKENTIPAKYYLKINAIRYLKTRAECHKEYFNKLYTEHKKSPAFIDKCLFIADMYLKFLNETVKNNSSYQFYTKSDYSPDSIIREINPHFVILRRKRNQKNYHAYEVFEEGQPQWYKKERIKKYIEFFAQEEKALPVHLIFICPNKPYISITRYIKRLEEADESLSEMTVTTREEMKENKILEHKKTADGD